MIKEVNYSLNDNRIYSRPIMLKNKGGTPLGPGAFSGCIYFRAFSTLASRKSCIRTSLILLVTFGCIASSNFSLTVGQEEV